MHFVEAFLNFVQARKWLPFQRKSSPRERDCRQLLNCLYQAAFGRLADANGVAHYLPRLQSGVSLQVVAEDLVGSAEFQARHGSGLAVDRRFITAMYRSGLGREPDSEGLASWLAEAEKGATRAGVLLAIGTSLEALENLTRRQIPRNEDRLLGNAFYKAALGRPAGEEGIAHVIQQLHSGASLEDLADDFVRSPEFQRLYGDSERVDNRYISALYRHGLGREPDLASLGHWLMKAGEGATRAMVLAAVAGSEEAVEKLQFHALDTDAAYRRWVRENDTIGEADRAMIRTHLAGLPFRPLISVIMPIETTNEVALRGSFESVVSQLYPYWELCLTWNAATSASVSKILADPLARDPRIKVIQTNDAESVVAAANAAFGSATGEFVTLLWSDDLLPEQALYEVAFELGRHEHIDVVYTDNDQISLDGRRSDPWFKPGWDPDLLLAQDYVSQMAVYRRTLLEAIGFLRPEFGGAELHDLALRATNATARNKIRHLPAVLYHRRKKAGTNHLPDPSADFRAAQAARRAVRDHLDARGDKEAVLEEVPRFPGASRVKWPLPKSPPLVTVIVPTRDRADLLARCVEGVLHRTDYSNLELLILDNGSIESTTLSLFGKLAREEDRVRVLHHPGPFNYSALNNAGAREARGEILILLNNDIDVIDPNWMSELVSQAIRPDVGIVGAKLLYADERVQHGGIVLGPTGVVHVHRLAARNDPGYFGQLALTRTLSAVTGACVAIRRSVFFEVDGFDEINLPVAFNDIDLCLKIGDRGYRVLWTPFAELVHLESASRSCDSANSDQHQHGLQHLPKTWGALTEFADPFHNPNLRFTWDDSEIPSLPRREKPWRLVFEQFYLLKRHLP